MILKKQCKVNGVIIPNDYKEVYDLFGIESTCPKDILNFLTITNNEDVEIDINSGGGSVFAGAEIYSALKAYSGKVIVNVTSLAGSAASIIMCAGSVVRISPAAQVMIHNSSAVAAGDYHDMEKTAEVLKSINDSICHVYQLKTGKPQEVLLDLMDKETWFSGKEAIENGFADELLFANTSINSIAASVYNLPILPQQVIQKTKNLLNEKKQSKVLIAKEQLALLKLKGEMYE